MPNEPDQYRGRPRPVCRVFGPGANNANIKLGIGVGQTSSPRHRRLEDVPPKPRRWEYINGPGGFRAVPSVCRRDIATSIAKTSENRHNATGFSLRFDDQQSIHNARRDSTEIGKKEATETTESEPLRRLSSQAQRLHQRSLSNTKAPWLGVALPRSLELSVNSAHVFTGCLNVACVDLA